MNLTCPSCFALISIETALESASGRELMGVLSASGALARPLAAYLGCFRSQSRALSWDRALKLVREVQAIDADPRALALALADTVESLRAKRNAGDARPLKNHNYLLSVLKSVSVGADLRVRPVHDHEAGGHIGPPLPTPPVKGKRAQALDELDNWGAGS